MRPNDRAFCQAWNEDAASGEVVFMTHKNFDSTKCSGFWMDLAPETEYSMNLYEGESCELGDSPTMYMALESFTTDITGF